jgi:phosphodiesterase/alkaline phosphatase D-like protein
VGETDATIWVETDEPCEVEVLGARERTWCVEGHHYALLHVEGLEPGTSTPYSVALDGEIAWPEPTAMFPHATIRTLGAGAPLRVAFGSCRVSAPHEPPYSLRKDQDSRGREIDAAYAYCKRMIEQDEAEWPQLLLLVGDQVYADEVSPGTADFIRSRRSVEEPPGDQVADFEEYAHLYWDSWGDPAIRWMLSAVASAMIFDDHDVHDDWNTSQAWLDEYRAKPWWNERITGALMSYWIYQHIGNLSPEELAEDELYARVREEGVTDAGPLLREFAYRADREVDGSRWSYARDLGATKLIVMDSRAGRVLEGRRKMVDEDEWDYIAGHAEGDFDHLLLATSLPLLLAPGMHYLEAWNEAVCAGAWGGLWARLGEKIRQGLDLEHWAAFQESFDRVVELLRAVATGERGRAPASIVLLSGDVHHAYLAEVAFPRGTEPESNVWQAVCSPVRNPLDTHERRVIKLAGSAAARYVARAFARAAGIHDPAVRWRFVQPPTFDNQVATIDIEGRHARLKIEKALPGDPDRPRLEDALDRPLS